MQPHDNDQRPSEGNTDGGRDAERNALFNAIGLAFAKVFNPDNGKVHLKDAAVDLSASIGGSGKMVG